MCWDPICTVAEVWCCSEHYLWLWLFFWWRFLGLRHKLQCIVIVWSLLRSLKLLKLALRKLDLSRAGRTWCHGVLYHGLNLHRNIPLRADLPYSWTLNHQILSYIKDIISSFDSVFTQNGANSSLLTKSSQLVKDFLPPLLQHVGINKGPEIYKTWIHWATL